MDMNFISQQNYHTLSKDPTTLEKLEQIWLLLRFWRIWTYQNWASSNWDSYRRHSKQQRYQPKFKTGNWDNWQKHLTPHLSNSIDNFQDVITEDEIEKQANLLTNIIVTTATEYFGLTQA